MGGMLDKLESIPGYGVQLSLEEIRQCVEKAGGLALLCRYCTVLVRRAAASPARPPR